MRGGLKGDLGFRRDVAHVMCDMNDCVVPLLDFLVQKWRKGERGGGGDGRTTVEMLDAVLGDGGGRKMGEEWKGAKTEEVRRYFHRLGLERLGRTEEEYPLLDLGKKVFFRGYEDS